MKDIIKSQRNIFFDNITLLLKKARKTVLQTVNLTMVSTYFEIGRMIVEQEQGGKTKAEYGKQILTGLSLRLTQEFGKGFSIRNIEQMRQFYVTYSKTQTVSAEFKLSWSHYLKLMRIDNEAERKFYEIECINNG